MTRKPHIRIPSVEGELAAPRDLAQTVTVDHTITRRTIAHIGHHGRSLCGAKLKSTQANPNAALCVVCQSLAHNQRMWQR